MSDPTPPRTRTWSEGAAALTVPAADHERHAGPKGPGRIESGLFYNPAMRFARDLTVLFLEERVLAHRGAKTFTVYEGLAATGVRGVRIAKEVRAPLQVTMNDRDAGAAGLIAANATANGVDDRVTVRNDDFVVAMGNERFDHVDVDPYGSPAPFLDAAIRHVRDRGSLAITATDMTALCGVFPQPCLRRYDALPWHGPGMHEVALRILMGAAVRHAARFDVALTPVLAHATDHYVRVFLTARAGAQRADAALAQIGRAVEFADGTRRVLPRHEPPPTDAARKAGPLWAGPLHDAGLIAALRRRMDEHPQLHAPPLAKFLERAAGEAAAPPLLYEIGDLARHVRAGPPRLAALIDALRAQGHAAARSHLSDTAVKTDAPMPGLVAAVQGLTDPGGTRPV